MQLRAAYAVCRGIARNAARNFYYGFLVLPRHKRNALSAVYAFMRYCDDIADDPTPGVSVAQRRAKLAEWQAALHAVIGGQPTDDPVLMAVADTQRRYKIPVELLDKLVAGTAMDVEEVTVPAVVAPEAVEAQPAQAPVAAYATLDELYGYCYHVASVVGLTCIHIFGYRDKRAEQLAEHTGIAFQLTNILRDVKEDALMGRVYIPRDELAAFNVNEAELLTGEGENVRKVLSSLADRARAYYASANELIPLVSDDARPALWVLVEIYRRLLQKIEQRNFDVFHERVRVPTREKLAVLGRGFLKHIV